MKNNFHPSRNEIVIAAKGSSAAIKNHLADCDWCALYLELLTRFQSPGHIPLISAPKAWIESAVAIASKRSLVGEFRRLAAKITFDSWAMPLPQGVRGEVLIQERRIRFEANDNLFDLRAEHRKNHWDFTAKVTDLAGHTVDCTLIAGKMELKADENGFYQWTSIKPPSELKIETDTEEIIIPELKWKKSLRE